MKLMIGSAQFGLDYGISNPDGQTPSAEIKRILEFAESAKINFLDTASAYGASEQTLGQFPSLLQSFSIVTKLGHLQKENISPRQSLEKSLSLLAVPQVYGLLFHEVKDLLGENGDKYFAELLSLKEQGLVNKIGVSVYTPEELKKILERYPIDLVQLPMNLLDQRFLRAELLKRAKAKNVEIHVRSAFLQGLLLMQPEALGEYFQSIKNHLGDLRKDILANGLTPVEACLAFLKGISEIDQIIVGVNNLRQLEELVLAYEKKTDATFAKWTITDEKYLLPMNWKKN